MTDSNAMTRVHKSILEEKPRQKVRPVILRQSVVPQIFFSRAFESPNGVGIVAMEHNLLKASGKSFTFNRISKKKDG